MKTLVVLLALACPAFAGSLTHHVSFGAGATSVAVPAFDASLGDLYEVQVSGSASYTRILCVENLSTIEGMAVDWGNGSPFGQQLVVRSPSGLKKIVNDDGRRLPLRTLHDAYDGLDDCSGASGLTLDLSMSQNTDLARITNQLYVGEFIGTGDVSCGITRPYTFDIAYYPLAIHYERTFYASMGDMAVTYLYYD